MITAIAEVAVGRIIAAGIRDTIARVIAGIQGNMEEVHLHPAYEKDNGLEYTLYNYSSLLYYSELVIGNLNYSIFNINL